MKFRHNKRKYEITLEEVSNEHLLRLFQDGEEVKSHRLGEKPPEDFVDNALKVFNRFIDEDGKDPVSKPEKLAELVGGVKFSDGRLVR